MSAPYYQDDLVTLYNGDCREILPTLTGFDAIVTDPPYGIASIWTGGKGHGWGNAQSEVGSTRNAWDREAPEIVTSLPALAEHSIIWGGNYFPLPPRRGWLVWDKLVRQFTSGHAELAWTTLDQPIRAFNFANGQLASEGKFHPTQKPVSLMEWCIRFLPPTCSTVLDPFAGAGTTLLAAKNEGRRAIGIELDESYCEIAAKRFGQDTLFGTHEEASA
jgi:DNA modification methylase